MDPAILLSKYRETLLEDIVPFWVNHAIDPNGGINTCIRDNGTVLNRDRWNWSQWRALWVFSKLFCSIEPRQEWVDIAHGIYRFAADHGPLENGHWALLVGEDGKVERGYESLYTDGFAIYGLVEYWRATGKDEALSLAMNTFYATRQALASETPPPTWPYPIPQGCKPHGLSMIFSLAYHELAEVTNSEEVRAEANYHHDCVMNQFLCSDKGFLFEWLNRDGSECEPPLGTVICPGHAIESMWFQIHIARARGDQNTIQKSMDAIRLHLERGWDWEYGGILLAIDADNRDEVQWPHADMKLWWPHTEALYATLLAHELTREDWCLEWHERVHDYSFSHYPQREHGEWRQKLDRRGQLVTKTVALPVKDPFHLPRALIYCIEVLTRLVEENRDFLPRADVS